MPLNFLARSGNRAETGVGGLGGRDRENGNEEEQLDGHFAYLVDDGVCLAVERSCSSKMVIGQERGEP